MFAFVFAVLHTFLMSTECGKK